MTGPAFLVVDIVGKGQGVIASRFISRGSLIISEPPMIHVPKGASNVLEILEAVSLASPSALAKLATFEGSDEPTLALFSRLKHFMPIVGNEQYQQGLFEIIGRANHSCRPNAIFYWNEPVGENAMRAVVDIAAGTEIEVSYINDEISSGDARASLQEKFGFTCMCPACDRPLEARDRSAERIRDYLNFVKLMPIYFRMKPPLWILDRIEGHILAACEEGLTNSLGLGCHDAFQLCAQYSDAKHAAEWEAICRDSHILRSGSNAPGVEISAQLVNDPRKFETWGQIDYETLRGPSDTLKALALSIVGPPTVPTNAFPPPVTDMDVAPLVSRTNQADTVKSLTRRQKKKARDKKTAVSEEQTA